MAGRIHQRLVGTIEHVTAPAPPSTARTSKQALLLTALLYLLVVACFCYGMYRSDFLVTTDLNLCAVFGLFVVLISCELITWRDATWGSFLWWRGLLVACFGGAGVVFSRHEDAIPAFVLFLVVAGVLLGGWKVRPADLVRPINMKNWAVLCAAYLTGGLLMGLITGFQLTIGGAAGFTLATVAALIIGIGRKLCLRENYLAFPVALLPTIFYIVHVLTHSQ